MPPFDYDDLMNYYTKDEVDALIAEKYKGEDITKILCDYFDSLVDRLSTVLARHLLNKFMPSSLKKFLGTPYGDTEEELEDITTDATKVYLEVVNSGVDRSTKIITVLKYTKLLGLVCVMEE